MLAVAILTFFAVLFQPSYQELPDGVHCPKYEIDEGGEFDSPEYSESTGVINGFHCWYNFKTGNKKGIVLEFVDFHLHEPMYTEKLNYDKYEVGCEKEFIEVYRDSRNENIKERYCGTELKGRTITSTSNQMKFVLNKYYKDTKGFRIKLRFVKKEKLEIDACKEMYAKEGDIMTKSAKAKCMITVKAPVGQGATLTVTGVNPLPKGKECANGKIQKKSHSKVTKGRFPICGADVLQSSFKAYTNVLDLGIEIPHAEIKAKISFNPLPPTCGGEIKLEAGSTKKINLPRQIETPVHNQLSCVWTVTIPNAAKGLKIAYNTFDLAPRISNSCGTDQFSVVEFKETQVAAFLQRQARETVKSSCAADLKGASQEFTGGKTIYLFLNMDFSVDHHRQLEADLSLL